MRRAAIALGIALLGASLAGCSAQGAAQTPEYRSIPTTANRAPDPAATPRADGSVTAAEAPLSQLWALVDSGLAHGGSADAERAAGDLPQDVTDLSAAIDSRCVPGLDDADAARLAGLWGEVRASAASAGADLTPAVSAYVGEAGRLCL